MTLQSLPDVPTMDPRRYYESRFGLRPASAYEAAKAEGVPKVRIGKRIFIITALADRFYGLIREDVAA